jgi:hypothetical protein
MSLGYLPLEFSPIARILANSRANVMVEDNSKDKVSQPKPKITPEKARAKAKLAANLKANLLKRKEQARGRKAAAVSLPDGLTDKT